MPLTRVQGTTKVVGTGTSLSIPFGQVPPVVGHGIVVLLSLFNGGPDKAPVSCHDNHGNTYVRAHHVGATGFAHTVVYYCAKLLTAAAPFTITVTLPATEANWFVASAIEVSGVGVGLMVDQVAGTFSAPSTTPNTGLTPPLLSNDLFAVAVLSAKTAQTAITVETVTPPWTQEYEELPTNFTTGEANSRALTGYGGLATSCGWSLSAAAPWSTTLVAFRPATAAPVTEVHGRGLTARDIITASLRSIRVLGVGDALQAEDANDALHRLNDWIDSLALERLTMYFVTRTVKRLTTNIQSYTIGLGGDIDIPRPTHLESAGLIQDVTVPTPFEKPLEVWTDQRWQGCRQKSLESTYPTAVYYDHNWTEGLAKLYVWPIPNVSNLSDLVLYTPVALREFATLDTQYTFPPGYRRFIRTNFAQEIASEYGKSLTADQIMAAKQAKAQVKRGNVRPVESRVDAALIRGFDYFDWRSGEPR